MSRWRRVVRVVRGVLGMGLTFGAVGFVAFSVLAIFAGVFFPGAEDDLGFMIAAGTVWSLGIGLGFSSVLAIAARGRSFEELTLPRVSLVGAGGGFALASIFVAATWGHLPPGGAMVPLTILPTLGAAGGAVALFVARMGGSSLAADDDPKSVESEGDPARLLG